MREMVLIITGIVVVIILIGLGINLYLDTKLLQGLKEKAQLLEEARKLDAKIIFHAKREILLLKLMLSTNTLSDGLREDKYFKDDVEKGMELYKELKAEEEIK